MDLKNLLAAFHSDEDGASATEYIILLILIACVIILIVKAFGATVKTKFSEANGHVQQEVKFK
jgi:pilus assembly protein Flp/PilA